VSSDGNLQTGLPVIIDGENDDSALANHAVNKHSVTSITAFW